MSTLAATARAKLIAGLVAALVSAGCGGDGGAGTSILGPLPTFAGLYLLESVEGKNLPAVIEQQGSNYTLEVLSGKIHLMAQGTYTKERRIRETVNGVAVTISTELSNGSWSAMQGAVMFSDAAGGSFLGFPIGTALVILDENAVYEK